MNESGGRTDTLSVHPQVFISYSWDSDDHHKEWVLDLAIALRIEGGVDAIIDQWHLKPGNDRFAFMERQIESSSFVLLICTSDYAKKANERSGGAGYEATIITSELAGNVEQTKFVPILRSGSWSTSLPSWLLSRSGIDLSGNPYSRNEWLTLLRHLHLAYPKPPEIGPKPTFVDVAYSERSQSFSDPIYAIGGDEKTWTLEGAARSRVPVGQSTHVLAKVSSSGSVGLSETLDSDDVYLINSSNIKRQTFSLKFLVKDSFIQTVPAQLRLRVTGL